MEFMETVSLEEACVELGCKRRQIFKLLKAGVLESAPRLGRKLRIFRASIVAAQHPHATRGRKRRTPRVEKCTREDFRDLIQ